MAADCRNGKDDPAPGSKRPAGDLHSDTASDVHQNGGASKLPRTSPDEAKAKGLNGDIAVPAESQKEDAAAAEVAEKRAALQAAKRAALEAAKRAALEALETKESASGAAAEEAGDTVEASNGNSSAAVADLSIVEVLKRESESAIGQVLDANARPGTTASASALIYDTPRDPLARSRAKARETTALVPAAVTRLTGSNPSVSPGPATGGDDSALAPTAAKAAAATLPPDLPAGARPAPRAVGSWAWGDGPGGVSFARHRAPRAWQAVAKHGTGPRPVGVVVPRQVPKPVGVVVPRTVPNPAGSALRGHFRPAPRLPSSRPGLGYKAGM